MGGGDADGLAPLPSGAGATGRPRGRAGVATPLLACAIGGFGLGFLHQVNFLLPLRARELGASFELIGLLVGAGSLVPALLSVPIGRVIDRLGARRSFSLGAALSGITALGYTSVTSPWALLALQVLLGGVWTLGWLASQTYVTSLGTGRDRARLSGRFAFFSNVGTMVGPLVAGLVAEAVGVRLAFGWLAAYALAFAAVALRLAEAPQAAQPGGRQGSGFATALRLLRLRGIQVALLLTFVRLWNEFVWTSFFPVFLVEQGLGPGLVGTVVFTKGLVATLLAPTVGYWSRFASRQGLAALGLACGAVGLLVSPHLAAVPVVYLPPALVGIGAGFSLPLLLVIVTEAVPAEQRGVALGLRMTVNQVAGAGAPILVGPLIAGLGVALGFATAGSVALGLLLASRVLHASARAPT